jgi:hypothetical protein
MKRVIDIVLGSLLVAVSIGLTYDACTSDRCEACRRDCPAEQPAGRP